MNILRYRRTNQELNKTRAELPGGKNKTNKQTYLNVMMATVLNNLRFPFGPGNGIPLRESWKVVKNMTFRMRLNCILNSCKMIAKVT